MNLSIFIKNNINLCNLDRKWNNATYFVNVIILEKTHKLCYTYNQNKYFHKLYINLL
ncbi:hypothetical protein [Plasmodium yoelii yoelii]|uniref:Uncharacterized protein n=1 Tax=Plasmodium yoelii yoelii TaxID=73239 RepID=Q7R953_PLAYO|nr:hypothetical protein [Plasmodium yoelii yoelii]